MANSMNKFSSRARASLVAVAGAAVLLSGCADMSATQKGTGIGAAGGAVAGALIGRDAKGAAIGAGVGALGGYIWSKHMQD